MKSSSILCILMLVHETEFIKCTSTRRTNSQTAIDTDSYSPDRLQPACKREIENILKWARWIILSSSLLLIITCTLPTCLCGICSQTVKYVSWAIFSLLAVAVLVFCLVNQLIYPTFVYMFARSICSEIT